MPIQSLVKSVIFIGDSHLVVTAAVKSAKLHQGKKVKTSI